MNKSNEDRREKRLRSHLVSLVCPLHNIEKTRKGKRDKSGTLLFFCSTCCRIRERETRINEYRERKAFEKISAYLKEQEATVLERRKLAAQNPQSSLSVALRQSAAKPTQKR